MVLWSSVIIYLDLLRVFPEKLKHTMFCNLFLKPKSFYLFSQRHCDLWDQVLLAAGPPRPCWCVNQEVAGSLEFSVWSCFQCDMQTSGQLMMQFIFLKATSMWLCSIDDTAALSLAGTVHNNGFTVVGPLLELFSGRAERGVGMERGGEGRGGLAGLAVSG